MRTSDLRTLLEIMITKQIPITPCLWGSTGIGKSSVPKQVAKALGYKVYDIRLSQLESVDLKGMPFTQFMTTEITKEELIEQIERTKTFSKKKAKMYEYTASNADADLSGMTAKNIADYYQFLPGHYDHQVGTLHHYSPDWFVTALQEGKCIIFLDELNRARPDVLQAAFELVLDRTINNQKLPDNVFILTACNPSTANYDTQALEDDALKARFMHLQVKSNHEDWLGWASEYVDDAKETKRIHPNVLSYILETPAELNFKKDDENGTLEDWIGEIHPVPRRWELVSTLEKHSNELADNILNECINGLVGNKVGTKYWATRKTSDRPVSLKSLLEWSDETKKTISRYSGNTEGVKGEEKKRGAKKEGTQTIRIDLINETLKDVMSDWPRVLKSETKIMVEFITLIPKDSATKLLKDLIVKQFEFTESDDKEIAVKYKDLLKALGKVPEVVEALKRLQAMESKNS